MHDHDRVSSVERRASTVDCRLQTVEYRTYYPLTLWTSHSPDCRPPAGALRIVPKIAELEFKR